MSEFDISLSIFYSTSS